VHVADWLVMRVGGLACVRFSAFGLVVRGLRPVWEKTLRVVTRVLCGLA